MTERLSSRQYGTMTYLQKIQKTSLVGLGIFHQTTVRSLITNRWVNYDPVEETVEVSPDGNRAIEAYRFSTPSLRKTSGPITLGVQNLLSLVRIQRGRKGKSAA